MTEGSDSAITAFRLASRLLPGIVLLVTIVAAILSLVEYDDYKTLLFDAFAALHIIGGVFGLASVFILPEYPISVPNEHANKKRAYKVVTALVNVVFVVVGIAVLIVRSANEANGAFVADLERSWTIYAYVGLVLDLIGILVLVAVNCGLARCLDGIGDVDSDVFSYENGGVMPEFALDDDHKEPEGEKIEEKQLDP